jgi:hypothetical protein
MSRRKVASQGPLRVPREVGRGRYDRDPSAKGRQGLLPTYYGRGMDFGGL